jgi:hypothetical protein
VSVLQTTRSKALETCGKGTTTTREYNEMAWGHLQGRSQQDSEFLGTTRSTLTTAFGRHGPFWVS